MDIESGAGDSGAAPAAESTPSGSTNDIASAVYDELEADAVEEADPEPAAAEPAPVEKMTAAEISRAEKMLIKAGFKDAKRGDGREFRIPRSKVIDLMNKELDSYQKESEGKYGSVEKERDSYKTDLTEFINAIKGDPKAFMEQIAQHDPRYQSFLTPQEKKEIAADAHDVEPTLVLDRGPDAYTASLKELRAWDRRQATREAAAKTEALIAPIAEREKAEKQRALHEKAQDETRTRVKSQIDEAQTWPLFGKIPENGDLTPFQQEVLDVFKANPTFTIHSAYMKVAGPRLQADETTLKAKWMKEMQEAPKSTSIPRTGDAPPKKAKAGSIRDVASEIYDAGA